MKHTMLTVLIFVIAFASCKKDAIETPPTQDPPSDARTILLKDMIVQNLPSPYYHFDYDDSGFITHVNYQSGLELYDLSYHNERIDNMMDNTFVNKTRLQYIYKDGKVSQINFQDNAGVFYK